MTTVAQTDDFTAAMDLPLSPPQVLELFSSAEGVTRWWGPTHGSGEVGGEMVTAFGHHGVNAVRVRELGPRRVVWESISAENGTAHQDEWLGTTLEWDLSPTATGTRLSFRHRGLTPAMDCWEDCDSGWRHFMGSIESYATTGTGKPYGS